MDLDQVDSAVMAAAMGRKRSASVEALCSEMPGKSFTKDRGKKVLMYLLNRLRLRKCASATISRPDPVYKVAYLGNVITGWAKGEGCVEKPLTTLWRNYTHSSRPDVRMQLSVTNGGLKATTKDHGLTEYWAHRLTTCAAPPQFPRLFCWVYRHEGRRLRHELRCHAVLCSSPATAKQIEIELKHALAVALADFKKDKISRQNARLSLANSVYDNPTIPRRKQLLSTGSQNYRPPLERSKSAPKLTIIEESVLEEEDDTSSRNNQSMYRKILRHHDSTNALLDKRKHYMQKMQHRYKTSRSVVPVIEENCDYESSKNDQETNNNSLSSAQLTMEEECDIILDELVKNSMRNDLLETCERAWINALGEKPDLIPSEGDEGSLSSGCESASTITSDIEPPTFSTIEETLEPLEEECAKPDRKKTDLEFKIGESVLSRVKSFEKISNNDMLKCRRFNGGGLFGGIDEVSLIPVGECHQDFSSLKVFKRKSAPDVNKDVYYDNEINVKVAEEDAGSACSDESGYEEEEDMASSVANIILV